jgi:hypothetical protein
MVLVSYICYTATTSVFGSAKQNIQGGGICFCLFSVTLRAGSDKQLSSASCNGCFACFRSFADNCTQCVVPTSEASFVQKSTANLFNEATCEAGIITGCFYITTLTV